MDLPARSVLGPSFTLQTILRRACLGVVFPAVLKSRAGYYVTVLSLVSTFLAAASTRITQ
jgi:hypothetical protein